MLEPARNRANPSHAQKAPTMSASTKPRSLGRSPKRPMVADLLGYRTAEAVETAQTLLDEPGLFPGVVHATSTALSNIAMWSRRHHVEQISDLTAGRAEQLLLDLTGLVSLQPMDPEGGESLHVHRNALIMLRQAVLLSRPSVVTRRTDRPAQDSIAEGLPEIGPRTGYRLRALRDDEITLARMLTALDLHEKAPLIPIHNYVLSEAGHLPMEITDAKTSNLIWSDETPTGITAKGVHGRGVRRVDFDPWQQHVLSITLPSHQRSGRPYLAYTGSAPGSQAACASTSPTLRRFLARAGVTGRDVNAGSVALWRPDHVLQHRGDLAAATEVIGCPRGLLLKNLHYTIEEISLHRGVATLVALDTRPDVRVPAGQVRGLGGWLDDENNPGTLRPAA